VAFFRHVCYSDGGFCGVVVQCFARLRRAFGQNFFGGSLFGRRSFEGVLSSS
jgi:hypothetical protein